MRVLFITNYADMYGANRSMVDLMLALKRDYDTEPVVLINGKTGDLGKTLDKYSIDYYSYEFRISSINIQTRFKILRKFTRRLMRYREYFYILGEIKRKGKGIDIVHSNTSITDVGYYISRRLGIPHVWHIREYGEKDYRLESIFGKKELQKKYSNSYVITISNSIDKYIKLKYGIEKTFQIYDGVRIVDEYKRKAFESENVRFVIVGAIRKEKGQFDAVKACSKLIAEGYNGFELHIVGDDRGAEASRIRSYVTDDHLGGHVFFDGYKENVNEVLKDMECGIMASYSEALGRVTIEYLANYMAVIGSRNGATEEILGDLGLTYEAGNTDELAECMKYYINNREMIAEGGLQRRKRAETFSVVTCAEKVSEVYKCCLKGNKNEV